MTSGEITANARGDNLAIATGVSAGHIGDFVMQGGTIQAIANATDGEASASGISIVLPTSIGNFTMTGGTISAIATGNIARATGIEGAIDDNFTMTGGEIQVIANATGGNIAWATADGVYTDNDRPIYK